MTGLFSQHLLLCPLTVAVCSRSMPDGCLAYFILWHIFVFKHEFICSNSTTLFSSLQRSRYMKLLMSTFHQQNIYNMKMVQLPLFFSQQVRARDHLVFTMQCIEYFVVKIALAWQSKLLFIQVGQEGWNLGNFLTVLCPLLARLGIDLSIEVSQSSALIACLYTCYGWCKTNNCHKGMYLRNGHTQIKILSTKHYLMSICH